MYLDSCILVKLVTRETDSFHYVRLLQGRTGVRASQLALVEAFSALCRKEAEGLISLPQRRKAWQHLESYQTSGTVEFQPVGAAVLALARQIIEQCQGRVPIRSLDAIHLATCQQAASFPLCSADGRMRDAANLLHIPLTPLP